MTEGLFGPDSMMWRINRESVLLLGGRAALLMQLAHPLVAAGVAQHSTFRTDPFGRLRRTLDTMLTIIFGDDATARAAAHAVRDVHDRVRGRAPDGRAYSAREPRLLLWVYSTLVDSSVRVYENWVASLTDDERARYYEETKIIAELFEVPTGLIPDGLEDLRAWMRGRIDEGEVEVTPLARELAEPVIRPVRIVPLRVAEASAVVTASLLPADIRKGYGLGLPGAGSTVAAVGGRAARLVIPRIPATLRAFPAARAAERRIA